MSTINSHEADAHNQTYTNVGLPIVSSEPVAAAVAVDHSDHSIARRISAEMIAAPPPLMRATAKSSSSIEGENEFAMPSLLKVPVEKLDLTPPSRPSLRRAERPVYELGPNQSSLIDDDDDEEMFDFFADHQMTVETSLDTATDGKHDGEPQGWNNHDGNVPTLPSFYPLDRNSVFVPQVTSSIVARRIQEVLRERSIAASYCLGSARAMCTSKNVTFYVRLYKAVVQSESGIVVEVQRWEGFDYCHQMDVLAILNAAKGEADQSLENEDFVGQVEDSKEFPRDQPSSSLKVILKLLSPRDESGVVIESDDFALTSLATLTDTSRLGKRAIDISCELLGTNEYTKLREVLLLNIITNQQERRGANRRRRVKSLEIISNALRSSNGKNEALAFVICADPSFTTAMVHNIEGAASDSIAATLSCDILNSFCLSSSEAKDALLNRHGIQLVRALRISLEHGLSFHQDLVRRSEELLRLIDAKPN